MPKLNQVEFIQSKQLVVTLTPGKHLYLLGKTGSGKSTLFNQLCGYDAGSNVEIKYNQNKIASFKRQDLRRQVTLVAQQGIILPGTIRENIWLTPESRLLPAEQKFFDDWVSRFEKGAETIVNEDHAGLSGGERQIIWILRALAQAKGLLLLDEITAALDGQIAKELTKLVDARQDLIVIEILHRTQHLKPTDKVLYLENGQLAYTDFKRVGQINDTNITAK
nr:ATP-binding cassette domain-containing protein [Ligilactobacillus apodemi]